MIGYVTICVLAEKHGEVKKFSRRNYPSNYNTLQIFALMKQDLEHLFKFPKDPDFSHFIMLRINLLGTRDHYLINAFTFLPPNEIYGIHLSFQ